MSRDCSFKAGLDGWTNCSTHGWTGYRDEVKTRRLCPATLAVSETPTAPTCTCAGPTADGGHRAFCRITTAETPTAPEAGSLTVERLAEALSPGHPLDEPDEWYASPRVMAEGILAALATSDRKPPAAEPEP